MLRKYTLLVSISLLAQSAFVYADDTDNSNSYPAPLTVENISESEKKDPNKVVEALGNTFIEAFQAKEYSQEEIMRSTQVLTSLTCIQYNLMQKIEASKLGVPKWEVKSNWRDPKEGGQTSLMEVSASTRDLAAGYAMCHLWNSKHIPLDRFTGFKVELVSKKTDTKD